MYDLIGDIHGHAAELASLLELLGYERHRGYYSHPARKAVFVGDFIDRGPQIPEVLRLVRPMVDHGSALAVMGNHEFNALCYHTPDPDHSGDFLRSHTDKNVHQHRRTLEQVSPAELAEYLEWFRELPMWLKPEGLRVVHACWDDRQIAVIRSGIEQHSGVTSGFLQEASTVGSPLHLAIEDVLKGKEIRLPAGMSYFDKDGHERHAMRTKWYESAAHRT
jgi:Calcineurin-like phosphoesterase